MKYIVRFAGVLRAGRGQGIAPTMDGGGWQVVRRAGRGRGQGAGRPQGIAPTMDGGSDRGWSGVGCGCPVWGRGDGPCLLQRRAAIKAPTRHPRYPRPYASEGLGKGCDEKPACESRQGSSTMDDVVVCPRVHHHSPSDPLSAIKLVDASIGGSVFSSLACSADGGFSFSACSCWTWCICLPPLR